jgi:hypothetical protein
MAIILLPVSFRQVLRGEVVPRLDCPADVTHVLVRNGTFLRHVEDGRGVHDITIQRYLCRSCQTTYSALPYDCRPYTAVTWSLVLAVGILWRERGWSLNRCQGWLVAHGLDYNERTLMRWTARWRAGMPEIIRQALRWVANVWGTRALPVWPQDSWTQLQHWRALWRAAHTQIPPARYGGWLATSLLWGWLPITFFAGMA